MPEGHDLSKYIRNNQKLYDLGVWQKDFTIYDVLKRSVDNFPDRVALVDPEKSLSITYTELYDRVVRFANSLSTLGLKKGDVIAFQLDNSFEFIVSHLGAGLMGLASVFLDVQAKEYEQGFVLNHTRTRALICSTDVSLDEYPYLEHIITLNEIDILVEQGKFEISFPLPTSDDAYMLDVSSGSVSGGQKVIVGPQALRIYKAVIWQQEFNFTHEDRFLSTISISSGPGSSMLRCSLICGGTYILYNKNNPTNFPNLIQTEKPTVVGTVPGRLKYFLLHDLISQTIFSSVKHLFMGCNESTVEFRKEIDKLLINGNPITGYSTTEFYFKFNAIPSETSDEYLETVGETPLGAECIIVDSTGNEVSQNQEGEILFLEESCARYLDDEESENVSFVNGWFHTGDLGYFTENNNLVITGKIKDHIRTAEARFHPTELEELIEQYPLVRRAAVIAKKNANRPDHAYCFIELKDNVDGNHPVDKDVINNFLKDKTVMKIKYVGILNSIPMLGREKIDRQLLLNMIN